MAARWTYREYNGKAEWVIYDTSTITPPAAWRWVKGKHALFIYVRSEIGKYLMRFYRHPAINASEIERAWGAAEPKPPTPAPPEIPKYIKEYAVQYWSDKDKIGAEILAAKLDADLIKAADPEGMETTSTKWITVGAQAANPLFNEIAEEGTGIRKIDQADEGYTFVQVGTFPPGPVTVWTAAGWTAADTMDAVKYIRDKGLPSTTIRIKTIPETDLQKAWREFVETPDVITAIGLLPSSVIESFSRVFTGHSYIDDEPAEPRPGDFAAVGSIIAGASLATLGTIGAGISAASAGAAVQTTLTGATVKTGMTIPGLSVLTKVMLGLLLVSQLDVVCWGFGICPTRAHDKIDRLVRSARSSLITLDKFVRTQDWGSARPIYEQLQSQMKEIRTTMEGADVEFFEKIGFSIEDLKRTFDTLEEELNAYANAYPALKALPISFPEEIIVRNVIVEDGDTIEYPGHPEAANKIRFVGIDTHEIGTKAGKTEAEYLKLLIEGKDVIIRVDPYEQLDQYGRLLGVPFLNGLNVTIEMLRYFGKDILTATKYHDKHKFVDWDELKREAAEAKGAGVTEFKINIDSVPSRAKLYIDGTYTFHLTPSNQDELKDVMYLLEPGEHIFKVEKANKIGEVRATIKEGVNPNIMIELKTPGLKVEEPVEIPPGEAPPTEEPVEEFSIYINSSPTRARLYIDGVYTHHFTESDERELSDVMELLTPGKHTITVRKAGKVAETEVEIVEGRNEPIFLTLHPEELPEPAPPETPSIEGLTDEQLAELLTKIQKKLGL